jgi:hypothetical protein
MTKDEGRQLINGELEGWETMQTRYTDHKRWSVCYSGIFKHLASDNYYRVDWQKGATEYQDEEPFDHDDPVLVQVRPTMTSAIVFYEVVE